MDSVTAPPSSPSITPPFLHLPRELHFETASHLEHEQYAPFQDTPQEDDFAFLNLRLTNP